MGFCGSYILQVALSLGISHKMEESTDTAVVNFGVEARVVSSNILQLANQLCNET